MVRLYESRGGRSRARIAVDGVARRIACADLLERELSDEPADAGESVTLEFRPFQLRTVRFSEVSAR